MGRRRAMGSALACCLVWAVSLSTARADQPVISLNDCRVGWQGHFKVGEWTRLKGVVTGAFPHRLRVRVGAPDPDDLIAWFHGPWFLLNGAATPFEFCFQTARPASPLRIEVLDEAGVVQAATRLAPSGDSSSAYVSGQRLEVPLIGTVGRPKGFENWGPGAASGRTATPPQQRPETTVLDSVAQLPRDPLAYDSLDALVLSTSSSSGPTSTPLDALDAEQSAALETWVRQGGHLVISVGEATEAFRQSRLAAWLPVKLEGTVSLRQLNRLETIVRKAVALPVKGRVTAARIARLGEGQVLADSVEGPILVRVAHGFGQVTVLALDLNRPPLADWASLPGLCELLVGLAPPETQQKTMGARQLGHLGITDMASQLFTAEQHFTGIRRPSYWTVMGLVLLYAVVIGPLDYLLVHRVFQRPVLTWITFPTWVCLGLAGSAVLGQRLNGSDLRMRQFDVLDVDAKSGTVRGQAWATCYSPSLRRHDLGGEINSAGYKPDGLRCAWSVHPENVVGGLYRPGGFEHSRAEYDVTNDPPELQGLPIGQWSTRTALLSWSGTATDLFQSRLQQYGSGRLTGSVRHRLPAALTDCVLVHGGRIYFPRNQDHALAPFETWEPVGPQGEQRALDAYLTQTIAARLQSDVVFRSAAYDPRHEDRTRLLQMMTFFSAINGSHYTGLNHVALRDLDWSALLKLDRAVFIGRARAPWVQVHLDGQPLAPEESHAYIRCLLPVQLSRADEGLAPRPD